MGIFLKNGGFPLVNAMQDQVGISEKSKINIQKAFMVLKICVEYHLI